MKIKISDHYGNKIAEFFTTDWDLPLGHKAIIEFSDPIPETLTYRTVEIEDFPLLRKSVLELDLTKRAYNCLVKEGIATIGQLTQKSENWLLVAPFLGIKSLNSIKEELAKKGLKLASTNKGVY